jgi:hypothetical protein
MIVSFPKSTTPARRLLPTALRTPSFGFDASPVPCVDHVGDDACVQPGAVQNRPATPARFGASEIGLERAPDGHSGCNNYN